MILHYIQIAWRTMMRDKVFAFINIIGLSSGMACCIIILLLVQNELSYDTFHTNANSLFRAYQRQEHSGSVAHFVDTPGTLAPALMSEYPEVKLATRYYSPGSMNIRYQDKQFLETGLALTDAAFFEMFTYPLISGTKAAVFQNPYSVVITEEVAQKYFGKEEPLGKVLRIDNRFNYTVTGVLQSIPKHSSYRFDILISFSHAEELLLRNYTNWGWNVVHTFILFQKGVNVQQFEKSITGIIQKHVPESPSKIFLQPLHQIRLYRLTGEPRNLIIIYVFIVIAFLVLLVACINFMNLSTAKSSLRAKEIGLRKVIGASRASLIRQFFGESILFSFLSLIVAMGIVALVLPSFNDIFEKHLSINLFENRMIVFILTCVTLVTGLLAGSYPSLVLSSFQPVVVLRGAFSRSATGTRLRKFLVTAQFSFSIVLIAMTIVVFDQVKYMQSKGLGYDKENLIYMNMSDAVKNKYAAMKQELLSNTGIVSVTATSRIPVSGGSTTSNISWQGKSPGHSVLMNTIFVDHNYLEAMGIPLASGTSFTSGKKFILKGGPNEFILNEEAVQQMGVTAPLGTPFSIGGQAHGVITGITRNFHFASLREEIEPIVIMAAPANTKLMLIRLRQEHLEASIKHIEQVWKTMNPNEPFAFNFLDKRIEQLYRGERQIGSLARYFTFLAILIACLGLYGLTASMTEQRRKEIGIRKILGASIPGLLVKLSKEFITLLLLSTIVAWPLAYYLGNRILQNFAYRISLGFDTLLLSLLSVVLVALVTISAHMVNAVRMNPVNCLRYE